jgi:tetratricopeptide (TPR) repeat protein
VAMSAVGRCRAGAEEATYAPLREVLAALAGDDIAGWIRERLAADDDGAQLAAWLTAAVGVGIEPGRPEETAWAARRLLAGLARERALLIVLDDVHWAAPAFLDLVESLVELARAPVLVLCLARPDLLDVRPQWGGGRLSSSAVLLDVLTETESDALLDRLSDSRLDAAARERILAAAEGNPLFIEQLLAAELEGEVGTVPDSVQTLLVARLDRLDDEDRATAQAAAVCGTSFTTEEVGELVQADPSASLLTLVRRELVRPGEADDPSGAGWSFRHSLIRDVAYGSLPKWRRAELHERLARRALERGQDVDLVAGHHLDQAVQARRESGERGAAVDRLAAEAAGHLARAGAAAYDRHEAVASVSLLVRADSLLPRDSAVRMESLPKLASALVDRGDAAAAQELFDEASAIAVELGDDHLAARLTVMAELTLLWTEAGTPPERILADVERAVPVLEAAADYEALACAEMLRFEAEDHAGVVRDEAERFSLALEYARRANARRLEDWVLGWICITLHRGAVPVDEAIDRATEIFDGSTSAYLRTSAVGAIGVLRAMKGEFDEARARVEEASEALHELGLRQAAAAHSIAVAEVEALAGDDAAAERILRAGFSAVTATGDEHSTKNVAWRLGLALARQGRYDEAEPFVRIAERTERRSFWVDIWWRVVLALIEAHRGHGEQARRLVEDARTRMATVPESGMRADALLESAEALRVAGMQAEAGALIAEAAAVSKRLGYVVAQRRAHEAQRLPTA